MRFCCDILMTKSWRMHFYLVAIDKRDNRRRSEGRWRDACEMYEGSRLWNWKETTFVRIFHYNKCQKYNYVDTTTVWESVEKLTTSTNQRPERAKRPSLPDERPKQSRQKGLADRWTGEWMARHKCRTDERDRRLSSWAGLAGRFRRIDDRLSIIYKSLFIAER